MERQYHASRAPQLIQITLSGLVFFNDLDHATV